MRAPRLLLLIGITSCGDNLAPDPGTARSGTRLKLARHVYEEGGSQVETTWFHDLALGVRCAPTRWSDGHTYCTPEAGESVFIEASCTISHGQVLRTQDGAPGEVPPYFVRRFVLGDEPLPSRLYRVAGPAPAPPQIWYLRGGVCHGPFEPGLVADYVALEEVAAARIRRLEIPVGDRLELGVHASDDGLRVPIGWRDRELAAACRIAPDDDQPTATCVPVDAHAASFFHDPDCAVPELAVNAGGSPPPFVRYRDPVSRCATHHLVGEPVTAPPLYLHTGRQCQSVTAPGAEQYFLLGAPLELPALGRAPESRDDRRVRPIVLSAGEVRVDDTVAYDARLAAECRPTLVGDQIRCTPVTDIGVGHYYADQQCQQPIALAEVPLGACASPPRFAIDHTIESAPLHAIGAHHTAPIFHLSTGERCLPFLPGAQLAFHEIGPTLTTELAAAAIEIDP